MRTKIFFFAAHSAAFLLMFGTVAYLTAKGSWVGLLYLPIVGLESWYTEKYAREIDKMRGFDRWARSKGAAQWARK